MEIKTRPELEAAIGLQKLAKRNELLAMARGRRLDIWTLIPGCLIFIGWIFLSTRSDASRPLTLSDVGYLIPSVLILWTGEMAYMHKRINAVIKLLELD